MQQPGAVDYMVLQSSHALPVHRIPITVLAFRPDAAQTRTDVDIIEPAAAG